MCYVVLYICNLEVRLMRINFKKDNGRYQHDMITKFYCATTKRVNASDGGYQLKSHRLVTCKF